jgi:hypothetical protein
MSKAAMVALYARVSSEQQNKRGTIESQIAALNPGGRSNSPGYGHFKLPHLTTVD